MLDEQILNEIEILIMNDGSLDDTGAVAQRFVERHSSFHLINKENGGHGSVINVASRRATGKYMKVLDSDDWFINFRLFVESLRTTEADVVLTNFHTVDTNGNPIREYRMHGINWGIDYTFEEFWANKKRVHEVCNFHGITYRTSFYNSIDLYLSEKISYEDQEYATLPFAKVQTVLPLNLYLYNYQIGNPNQSNSDVNLVKHLSHLEHVFWNVHTSTPENMPLAVNDYFSYKKCKMLLSCYMAAMVKNPDRASGRVWAKRLRLEVKKANKNLYRKSRANYYTCLFISYIKPNHIPFSHMQRGRAYKVIAKWMH